MNNSYDDYIKALRNQRLAEQLTAQASAPLQYDPRGVVSGGQLIGNALSGIGAKYYQGQVDKDTAELSAKKSQQLQAMFAQNANGQPNQMNIENMTPEQSMFLYQNNPKVWEQVKGQNLQTTEDQKNAYAGGQGKEYLGKVNNAKLAKMLAESEKLTNGDPAKVAYTPVSTGKGVYAFNGYTGKMEKVADNEGSPVLKVDADVDLAGRKAAAEAQAKSDVTSVAGAKTAEKQVSQLSSAIRQARKLLPEATGSGIGALVDKTGRLVGASSDSSIKASQLATLSGWMVSNVPRMEGPQSNFDVENYKVMAANVGDSSIPASERIKMLDTLEEIQAKYSELNKGVIGGGVKKETAADRLKRIMSNAN